MKENGILVTVVIPHYLGNVILECLEHLYRWTQRDDVEVLVVDNQPRDDGSLQQVSGRFPDVRLIRWQTAPGGNIGYGAGCNRGLESARGRYVLLLNNDVIVTEGWLEPLLKVMDSDQRIAACQPKMLSAHEKNLFDSSGAAGGLMDSFGYPFCLGRVFDEVEVDAGQYDQSRDIFWAIGAAMFVRLAALADTGKMDEDYVMHMEEIDLCWRLHLAGYRVVSVPDSVVLHYGAMSLGTETFKKAYVNHRNNLVMVMKNWSLRTLLWALPIRLAMEGATVLAGPLKGQWRRSGAALAGLAWVLSHPLSILRRRRVSQASRQVSDAIIREKLYRGSVVVGFFLRGRRTASALLGNGGVGR